MHTRSKSGTFKKRHIIDFVLLTNYALHVALLSKSQPKGYKSIAKHPQWMVAIHEEIKALRTNNTWTLVPRPSHSNIFGSKWVYRTKYNYDGSIERFKAHLVA